MTTDPLSGVSALSSLAPYPPPWSLDPDLDRHAPTPEAIRRVLTRAGAQRDWSVTDWSGLIEELLAWGRTDIGLSRLAEGHVDALRILAQAGREPVGGAHYGVWASRSQRTGVQARRDGSRLVLDGTIRFASGAGVLDRALVPVWTSADQHLLLDLTVDRLPVDAGQWATGAMEVSRSHTVTVEDVVVDGDAQVGPVDFYLSRPQFLPGGVGVAACWAGGAARVADLTWARLRDPAPALRLRLGRIRVRLATAGAIVRSAAARLDALFDGEPDHDLLRELSTETRAGVASAVHDVLDEAHRVAGPAGLAYDENLTRAVHDLRLYVLQQNEDADAATLGEDGRAAVERP